MISMRPYHVYLILLAPLVVSTFRLWETPGRELAVSFEKLDRWEELARSEPEDFKSCDLRRYRSLSKALSSIPEAGYCSELDKSVIYSATRPDAVQFIKRYYRAQFVMIPTVLRYDRRLPLIVVDCADPASAARVVKTRKLISIRDFGQGLVLARPDSDGP